MIPIAIARLDTSAPPYRWIVDECPICGGRHSHGAGTDAARVQEYLGHRVAHCAGGSRHRASGRDAARYTLVAVPS